jgi:large subunit ribosomal protein L5
MQVPKLEKIVLNVGCGKAIQEPKLLEEAIMCLTNITGQKPIVTKSKTAISNFKLREGMSIGCSVTLRANRMYEFLERLISISLPRIRDFRGLSKKSFDKFGNYTFGVTENIVFLEINRDKISKIQGLSITICTNAGNKEVAFDLLSSFGMPFKK